MSYRIKEIFYSLQGEGVQTGRAAVFCRFAGCNLWSGRELDRPRARCQFCDTDFVGTDGQAGGNYDCAITLASTIAAFWPTHNTSARLVVLTGGEPLLQLDVMLVHALHYEGFEIALETNGTLALPAARVDWVCVSPKAGEKLTITAGDELKLIFPQPGINPNDLLALHFRHFLLQPMDSPSLQSNTAAALAYCLQHPSWRLSLQLHKQLGIQ